MSLRRLLPDRWARIVTWTSAAVAWGTTAVAVATTGSAAEAGQIAGESPSPPSSTTTVVATPALPMPPDGGLVVIRYTPAERPPAQVITRTVPGAAPASPAAPATERSAPAPAQPTVTSSGS